MKIKNKSFRMKLWSYFVLFASIIFIILWLIQTVFLQSFYSKMAINNLHKEADKIINYQNENILDVIDEVALKNSLLIFLCDNNGNVLYNVDEYSRLYEENNNPYNQDRPSLSYKQYTIRNLSYSHLELINQLLNSNKDDMGYTTSDAYIYGAKIGDIILCISMPLGSVDGTTSILKIELAWMMILSLLLAFILAYILAYRFEKPIKNLVYQAKRISNGDFITYEKSGFCNELDDLADTLNQTANDLERLENYRNDLLSSVSHDLRTPLTMISGYVEMVQEFSWKDENMRNHDLAIIQKEASRLTALVNEILEYSNMKTNGINLQLTDFNLSEVLEETVEQFISLWENKGYHFEKRIAKDIMINADSEKIKRVIYNFIDNAINHTEDNKDIVIKLEKNDNKIRVAIQDHGPGISKENIPYIWDKYYTSRSRNNKNTVSGLGLSISKKILEAHNYHYGVISEDGCEFYFEINV